MSGLNSFNGSAERVPSRNEKKRDLLLKLRDELKVFNNSVLVIDAENYVKENKLPEPADIFVVAKGDLKDIRDYLNGELGIAIREGPSPILNKKDTAFYLKIIE